MDENNLDTELHNETFPTEGNECLIGLTKLYSVLCVEIILKNKSVRGER